MRQAAKRARFARHDSRAALAGAQRLILDERFQSGQGVIPLFRDARQRANRFVERVGLELEEILAPCRTPRTRPASSSTRKCLVIACRERGEPAESVVIDERAPPPSLASRARRVSSPSAAKIGAHFAARVFPLHGVVAT